MVLLFPSCFVENISHLLQSLLQKLDEILRGGALLSARNHSCQLGIRDAGRKDTHQGSLQGLLALRP